MSTNRPAVGLDHLTVVPTNYDDDADDAADADDTADGDATATDDV
ncbi:hypothetical protein [Halarchaeum nitratireducens]|nr:MULTISPECIES: hypothetical protein [Halarchaeum]MBP2251587.1 hypothetical protein [Halarchaeum solikamskense]